MLTTPQLLDIARDIAIIRNRLNAAIAPPPATRADMQRFMCMPADVREQMTALSAVNAQLAEAVVRIHRAAELAAPVVDMVLI